MIAQNSIPNKKIKNHKNEILFLIYMEIKLQPKFDINNNVQKRKKKRKKKRK